MPKFIGPYKSLKAMNESSNVTLELPQEFKDRKINPTFHTNLVQPYIKNDDILFPRGTPKYNNLELQVKWTLGDVTWEPLSSCKDLEALDVYLELRGAKAPRDLLWHEQAQ